ncbi:Arm DNA-binding domain-containing protein [Halomonas sp. ISL-56]|uniref:Arm DNA-binding domain-containing protein n=1 Tax=Halomonas sp. ISL-56 TaxID=2819149 RepID=UPI003334D1AE
MPECIALIDTFFDGTGLELRIWPDGSQMVFALHTPQLQVRNMTSLGIYPEVSLAEAREKRADSITRYRSCRVEVGR